MIKAIIFDLGGVLFENGTKKFMRSLSERTGLPEKRVKELLDGKVGTAYRENKITRDEFWKQTTEALGLIEDIDVLENEWIDGYKLIEGTRDIIFKLAKKYKVYYLSDNVQKRVEKINSKYDFLKWFEDGIFSHEAGFRKPHPKIYEHTIEKIGISSKEAVFIDDRKYNLAPAKEMGMETILFDNPEQLNEELVRLKLL